MLILHLTKAVVAIVAGMACSTGKDFSGGGGLILKET